MLFAPGSSTFWREAYMKKLSLIACLAFAALAAASAKADVMVIR
jgi:hypothetical protein